MKKKNALTIHRKTANSTDHIMATATFSEYEKVIYAPENKVYDFGYLTSFGKAVIYEEGCRNMQDSFVVDMDELKRFEEEISSSEFFGSMTKMRMVPICPECKRECFAPVIAQSKESEEKGLIILWCIDFGHWSGDVKEAHWKHMSTFSKTRNAHNQK
jgi:hypothetical protein